MEPIVYFLIVLMILFFVIGTIKRKTGWIVLSLIIAIVITVIKENQ